MKKALFIAYQFPPQGGGGVQRTTKFLKYLPMYDWQGTVITGKEKTRQLDHSLAADISPCTAVERVRGVLLPKRPSRLRQWLRRWVLTVDTEVGWLPAAVQRSSSILKNEHHSLIYSTSAPYTDHLVGLQLKQKFQLPWIADFRDPWTQNINANFPTPLHRRLCEHLETAVVTNADCVLVVSEPMRQLFIQQYPQMKPEHFITITNGYDSDDYQDVAIHQLPAEKFHLIYTGSLYGRQSVRSTLIAIRNLIDKEIFTADNFSFWLIGSYGLEAPRLITEMALGDIVQLIPYIPHSELMSYQLAADALLLIIGDGPRSDIILTGKLFEYLATQRPILALIPPGAAEMLLEKTQSALVVRPDDTDAVADAIEKLFHGWQQGQLKITPNLDVIEQYSRRHLTRKLVDVFEDFV